MNHSNASGKLETSYNAKAQRPYSRLLTLLAGAQTLAMLAAALLRSNQLSLDDPYNNPYTFWSTTCLFASMLMYAAGAIWALNYILHGIAIPAFVVLWLLLFSIYFGWMFLCFIAFIAPW